MDDFYTACQEKIRSADNPSAAINELVAISLRDLPTVQICTFAEQATTLLSVIFQTASDPQRDLTILFQRIRHQLEVTLDYMEQVMEVEKEFPSPQSDGDGCWW